MQRFDLHLANGDPVHVQIYRATNGQWGLTVHDGNGKPIGKGRTLSERQAQALAKSLATCRETWKASLVWSALGYERRTKRAVARAICHPGRLPVQGNVKPY